MTIFVNFFDLIPIGLFTLFCLLMLIATGWKQLRSGPSKPAPSPSDRASDETVEN